jgi:DNA-binding response OmpR family regulator
MNRGDVESDGSTGDPTVLVVEDEPRVAEAYAVWLREDYRVRIANGGEEALEILAEVPVDVVLLDRHMPDVTGDEVLVTLRDWGLEPRVAMVTGVTPDVDILDLGFDDYLQKPVDAESLRATVERLLEPEPYESLQFELGSLRVKRNVLEVEQPAARLADDPRYRALCDRIERLEARVEARRSQVGAAAPAGD